MTSLQKKIRRFFRKMWNSSQGIREGAQFLEDPVSTLPTGYIIVDLTDHGYGNYTLHTQTDHLARLTPDQGLMLIGEVIVHTTGSLTTDRIADYLNAYRALGARRFAEVGFLAPVQAPDSVLPGASTTAVPAAPVDLLARFRGTAQVPYQTELMPIGDIVLHYGSPYESTSIRLRRHDIQWRLIDRPDDVLQRAINVPHYRGLIVPGWEQERTFADRAQTTMAVQTTIDRDRTADMLPVAAPAGRAVRRMFPNGSG